MYRNFRPEQADPFGAGGQHRIHFRRQFDIGLQRQPQSVAGLRRQIT